MRRYNGFTLIELLVTITIVGILVAIAAPSLSDSTAKRSLEGVASELSTDLQYAKSQAVSVNTTVSVVTSANGYIVSSASSTFKTILLDSKIALSTPVTVTFEPYRDFANAATAITVTHTQTSAQLQVKVDALGGIQLCSPSASFGGYPVC